MSEHAKYASPKEQCLDERARMLKAMNEALAKPNPDERLNGVVAVYKDKQYGLPQKKAGLTQELYLWETLKGSPLKSSHESGLHFDWQPVYEAPAAAALRIVRKADDRKTMSCAWRGNDGER